MTVNELIKHLATLDSEMNVELGDSAHPSELLEKENIWVQDGKVIFY